MAEIPQHEKDYQLSHASEFNSVGVTTFVPIGMVIVGVAVGLRLWARKISHIPWMSDDYTLIAGFILTCGAGSCILNMCYNGWDGRHILVIDDAHWEQYGKTAYGFNVLYTTAYPVSRISLVLLYHRVFVQPWFRYCCWVLVALFAGYSFSTVIADLCTVFPVEAGWNRNIKPTRKINTETLYIANCGFNISTDAILLLMPWLVIWRLNMTILHKLGLSAIFSLGILTVLASIFRLIYYYRLNPYDLTFSFSRATYWTMTELFLGLLCPCLVTFRPLIRSGYLLFSSHLSPRNRERISRMMSGLRSDQLQNPEGKSFDAGQSDPNTRPSGSSSAKPHGTSSAPHSLRSKPSDLEAGRQYEMDDLPPVPKPAVTKGTPAPRQPPQPIVGERDKDGMAVNQDVAVANLDPRAQAQDLGHGNTQKLGTSTEAVASSKNANVPEQGIGVSRDYKLESS